MATLKLSDYQNIVDDQQFWVESVDKKTGDLDVKIKRNELLLFLQQQGFYRYYYSDEQFI